MKKILLILSLIFIIISITLIGYKLISAKEEIKIKYDEVTIQKDKDSYITPYGYTIDNPNIILNPYDISPLTAIISFTTKESLPVEVTIKGKDENSTYTNTFNETTNHYIPIYGLYPNYKNEIILKIGNDIKSYFIETKPIEVNINKKEVDNNSNKLIFISEDNYPYALDNNNDIRWYLTKKYTGKIDLLTNNNLLLSSDKIYNNIPYGIIELDLLGKIYKQYNIDTGYYKSFTETKDNYYILSKNIIKIDKQNGSIYNEINLKNKYETITYEEEPNIIKVSNTNETLSINIDTLEQKIITKSEKEIKTPILPLYTTKDNYKVLEGQKYNLSKKTKQSKEKIFLLKYKKTDNNYNKYKIKYTLTEDNLIVEGLFTNKDNAYIILDKFLDKKVYKLNNNINIFSNIGLKGKYSIYIKINNNIYKTNKFINL